ncbi:MBL fold metallo-hydrolase [Clostridium sardiniense]|uniref:MBL fold metallo-hydrolase n=1 Tax=Clostridium sardiniense TaxID=29369 RepID=UPI00311CCAA5
MKYLKVTALVENTTVSTDYRCKHGLCLNIKTSNHNILFDLGSDDLFIENAKKLNIDIKDIDIVIISHGHRDHGGGLSTFLEENKKAKIYINRNAFMPHYVSIFGIFKGFIGLDISNKFNDRIIFVDKNLKIDDELYLFSNVSRRELVAKANNSLLMKIDNKYIKDNFKHEQNLIITENDRHTLITGCAHNGIVNILDKGEEIVGQNLNTVIGGFHLFNPAMRKHESKELIKAIGDILAIKDTEFYTCHCTGIRAFNILRDELGEQIKYLSTGGIINI